MARGRRLSIVGMIVALVSGAIACGDAEWPGPGSKAPPLNAGPGTLGLTAPAEAEPSAPAGGGIEGDWFFCAAREQGDPCAQVNSTGFRLRADGKSQGLQIEGEELFVAFPAPYCVLPGEVTYDVVGDAITLRTPKEEMKLIFKVHGDRASVTSYGKGKPQKLKMIRANPPASTGPCADDEEPPID